MPHPATDRRHPYRPFDRSLIRDFLGGRGILSVELLASGRTNTNYKLILSDGQVCVVRLYSRGDAKREAYVMSMVRDLVQVPRELARGETWAVFSFLEGELLENAPAWSGAAAEALARISTVRFESPGWMNGDGTVSPFSFEGGKGFFDEYLERPEVCSWLGTARIADIRVLLKQEAGRFAELGEECRLVHGDFNPTNILVREGAVTGILDWEWSHSGTPYMDIGNLLRNTDPMYHPQIEAGLEAGGMHLPGDWKQRAKLVDLSSQVEFLTSGRSDEFKRRCVGRIERCLARFGCRA